MVDAPPERYAALGFVKTDWRMVGDRVKNMPQS
jgi:hypothetical protein